MNTTKGQYTVEVYKADLRQKRGERWLSKTDYEANLHLLRRAIEQVYPSAEGFRFDIKETFVTRRNIMSGQDFVERYDTPFYCSPASETYWCS